ncbi:MAG TPA: hypothetical protein VE078_12405 [Thermoanaerobaculia bacterium]|nr:hypothetical protein [Thermoanaerobaculia bacterium]
MSRTVRTTALAAVLVLTAASAAQASPPSAAAIWDWVTSWISPAGMRPLWEKAGCQMDPDGICEASETAQKDTSTERNALVRRGRS